MYHLHTTSIAAGRIRRGQLSWANMSDTAQVMIPHVRRRHQSHELYDTTVTVGQLITLRLTRPVDGDALIFENSLARK